MFRTWSIQMICLFTLSLPALAGGVSGGGGGQAVMIDGKIRFLDLVSDAELKSAEDTSQLKLQLESIEQSHSALNPSQQASPDLALASLEDAAIGLLQSDMVIFLSSVQPSKLSYNNKVINSPKLIEALRREGSISDCDHFYSNSEAIRNGISPSKRLGADKQINVGWFDGSKLHLQPLVFLQLSPRDRFAFMLHEGLRYYNSINIELKGTASFNDEFTTEDIENTVPQLLKDADQASSIF